jgi:hypothetical protein
LAVKVAWELVFFGYLVSDISFLVEGEGVVEIVEFKFHGSSFFFGQEFVLVSFIDNKSLFLARVKQLKQIRKTSLRVK